MKIYPCNSFVDFIMMSAIMVIPLYIMSHSIWSLVGAPVFVAVCHIPSLIGWILYTCIFVPLMWSYRQITTEDGFYKDRF